MHGRAELSRRQVSFRLGCSQMQVIRFEQQGKLHPRRERPTGYSRVWYSLEEVQKLDASWVRRKNKPEAIELQMANTNARGKLAARAFKMFRDGRALADVVIELEIDPILARQFWEEYQLSFEDKRRLQETRAREERDRAEQRRKDRADSLRQYREHQEHLAEIAKKATIEAAKEAARIAARRTG